MKGDLDVGDRQNGQLRQAALRLVRCMGSRAALDCCQNNQWQGLYEEIQNLDGRNVSSQH